jgi:hypothetical protein
LSQQALDAILERALEDVTFRMQLLNDPTAALAGYELTPEEFATFQTGSLKAERLEPRISKNDLSAALSAKTSTPTLTPPSKKR